MKRADLTYLLSMSDGNNDLIFEIIDIFVVQAEEIWLEMQSLYDSKNYDDLGKLAHKAKSSVAILGMKEMAEKLKELELSCQDGIKFETYQNTIHSFKSECIAVIKELQNYKESHLVK